MPPARTLVATANVLDRLPRAEARAALAAVLREDPDLVGLQEWGRRRSGLLAEHPDYRWVRPAYGGNPVGARAERYALVSSRLHPLGWFARSDRGARPVPVLPPRVATVVVLRDLWRDRLVTIVNYHLVPGVQRRGAYREDRPHLVARHRAEVRRLGDVVEHEQAHSAVVFAVGDSNLHGLRLPGLTSAWAGREDGPGTLGSDRKIDDVFGPGPAQATWLVSTPSDHRAVLAVRPDG